MVEQSELAWRLLGYKYGATLAYSPMLNAKLFATNEKYREEMFSSTSEDKPNLIVQFCANDPDYFLKAAQFVQDKCIAVDLNLGCPQHIARRGHYGSFLQDEWDLIESMVSNLAKNLSIPVTAKIRVFEEVEKTVEYAKMIERAGVSLLAVHGRLREQKGTVAGLADWSKIADVKKALSIPVVANGNIIYHRDIDRCVQVTGVDGVMSAEGHLFNPAIFTDKLYASWFMAEEYLQICKEYPNSATPSQGKAHFFKLFHSLLPLHIDLREELGTRVLTWAHLDSFVAAIKKRVINEFGSDHIYTGPIEWDDDGICSIPPWVCQPKIRKHPPPTALSASTEVVTIKRTMSVQDEETLVVKAPIKKVKLERGPACEGDGCMNTRSESCVEKRCKRCCRSRIACPSHLSARSAKAKRKSETTRPATSRCAIL